MKAILLASIHELAEEIKDGQICDRLNKKHLYRIIHTRLSNILRIPDEVFDGDLIVPTKCVENIANKFGKLVFEEKVLVYDPMSERYWGEVAEAVKFYPCRKAFKFQERN